MAGEAEATKWVSPETNRKAVRRARDRANTARWNLEIAIFLVAVLAMVIILLFQDINVVIVALVAILGLAVVWLVGHRQGNQLYRRFLGEELAQHPDEWKDYYRILRIGPNTEFETITEAYERLSDVYREALSDEARSVPMYSLIMREVTEAHQVLSNPIIRTAYDRIFWLKRNVENIQIDESAKYDLVDLSQSISRGVSEAKRRISRRIPRLSKATRRVVLGVAIVLFSVLVAGTSLAFTKPEHVLAAPFRGIAITLAKASVGAANLIEEVRGIAATQERGTISTALQSMRVEEQLKQVPLVTVSTNDMACFPSREYCLFPDYLDRRFSQFKYTVDSTGVLTVDKSWATTDAFVDNIKRLLDRLEK